MHPIILRAGALPGQIRNASGNGGGILIGYLPIVGDPAESPENEDDTLRSVKLSQYKREVYHRILSVIFKSLKNPSFSGEKITCGDKVIRIIFPGFLIASVDLEEAYSLCGTRGSQANHPCPRCLVPHTQLHAITSTFQERTEPDMVRIFEEAKLLPKSAQLDLLKDHGLHLVKNCFWSLCRSSPYHAYSYDVLHSFDSGEWGKHQWPQLNKILTPNERTQLSRNMAQVPRWPKLRHFNNVTSANFADGNSYRDILKCIIPCLAPILSAKSPVFQALRWCGIIRGIIGLKVITEDNILYLEQTVLPKYHEICMDISRTVKPKKTYDYPKHHMLLHAAIDLRRKGCIDNYSTRPGEGFQQEVKQAYRRTNFKNVESQMVKIDETHEAMARIRMFVDQFDAEHKRMEADLHVTDGPGDESLLEKGLAKGLDDEQYSLGSESKVMRLFQVEENYPTDPNFSSFASNLLEFLACNVSDAFRPSASDDIIIRPYKCLYITYQSMEDWRLSRDILRCNPQFHGLPRFDFVAINTDPVSFAQLIFVFTCEDSKGRRCDLALVRMLVPKVLKTTYWEGMQSFEEEDIQFICLKYVIRGCHFVPLFPQSSKIYFLNDLVDNDAFIRFFLGSR